MKSAYRFRRLFLFGALVMALGLCVSWAEEQEERHGVWLERDDGRTLFFTIEENNFHLEFYDEEREPVKPDLIRAVVHYTPRMVQNRETIILTPDRETGETFTSPRFVRPPHNFQVLLVLVRDTEGRDTETFSFRYVPDARYQR